MCWYCGSPVTEPEPIGRSRSCIDCGKDLRACKNCRHYRPDGCAESQAEKPQDQTRATFCDWFSLNPIYKNPTAGEKKPVDEGKDAKAAFNDLFK